MIMIMIMINHR